MSCIGKNKCVPVKESSDIEEELFKLLVADVPYKTAKEDLKLLINSSLNTRIETAIISKVNCLNHQYDYIYPICWFRSMPFLFMLDKQLRKLMLTHIDRNPKAEHKIHPIREHLYKLLKYTNNIGQGLSQFYFITIKKPYVTMEHAVLYFMTLLYEYNPDKFPFTKIQGGWGRRLFLRFFNLCIPNICPSLRFQIITIVHNNKLIMDLGSRISPNLDVLVIDYGPLKNVLNVLNLPFHLIKNLALYVKSNGHTYALTSFIQGGVNTVKNKAHMFPICSCNGRFVAPEIPDTNNLPFIGDVNLIETLLCDQDPQIQTYIGNEFKIPFNLNDGPYRVGIYQKCELVVSIEELEMLQEYVQTKSIATKLAILACFVRNMTFEIGDKKLRWMTNVLYDVTDGSLDPISTFVSTTPSNKKLDFEKYFISIKIIKEATTLKVIDLTVMHKNIDTLLKNMLDRLAKREATKGGSHQSIRYKKRIYKVRQDKQGEKYIMCDKRKTPLKAIRRQYRWCQ